VDPEPIEPELVWREVARTASCSDASGADFSDTVTYELYVGLPEADTVLLVSTGIDGLAPLRFSSEAVQHPFGGNTPPSEDQIDVLPCLVLDSYFTLGTLSSGSLIFVDEPSSTSWPLELSTLWASTSGAQGQQNPAAFDGSEAYFVRLLRVTLRDGSVGGAAPAASGEMQIGARPFGGGSTRTFVLDVPALP